ncbi:MAG: cupin domain-containing protein [Catalinimonas sp.]
MLNAHAWIDHLELQPHPEGGYFRETYRSAEELPAAALPGRYGGARAFATSIYFMLYHPQVSHLHRIRSDEAWYFHTGDPLRLHVIAPDGTYTRTHLGPDPTQGHVFQTVVPRGHWFGAEVLNDAAGYTLLGCTVAPGFDFADFELAERWALLDTYPQHTALIERLTA